MAPISAVARRFLLKLCFRQPQPTTGSHTDRGKRAATEISYMHVYMANGLGDDDEEEGGKLPYSLTIEIPFPTNRLAHIALKSLSVDVELSSLVTRDFALVSPNPDEFKPEVVHDESGPPTQATTVQNQHANPISGLALPDKNKTVLRVFYRATTPRMLRVAVNGFFESLNLIVQVMEELDVDVLHEKGLEDLEGVQGVEQGLTGTARGVVTG